MYLSRVLTDIKKEADILSAEHLFKLNEAIFNLPDDDKIDEKIAKKIFEVLKMIRSKYMAGEISDKDDNFFYDHIALLGTLQNQHFFTLAQTDAMLTWIKEAVDVGGDPPAAAPSKATTKKLKELEEEGARLRAELEKLRDVSAAVQVLQSFKPISQVVPVAKAKAKEKAKTRGKARGNAQKEAKAEAKVDVDAE
eukprot:TRINITY_DN45566_c0_g1_i1.p1 TRINITY_DN45566_c0_g1~~TRINITY_DN45566_c0_g1_i1.p1  ORF type:complete len:195 (+),score=63.83 TRINITY_DN45566_c0_g1_i1:116-700(+)